MYFEACEHLADERPELKDTIAAVDRLLFENQGRDITFDFLTTFVSADRFEIQFIYETLQESPAFSARTARYCATHDQPVSEAGVCDVCDDSNTDRIVEVTVIHVPKLQFNVPNAMTQKPPRVLISYSHDSPEHAERVLRLSDQLRQHGIDSHIDQYTPVPEVGWPLWMEHQIQEADYVLCVCSEEYRKRFSDEVEADVGRGVSWEANLIRNALYETKATNSGKFLTVQFDRFSLKLIPGPLKGFTSFTLTDFSLDSEGYEKLYRHLTDQPATPITALGKIVQLKPRPRMGTGAPDLIPAREAIDAPATLPVTRTETLSEDELTRERGSAGETAICRGWKEKLRIYQEAEANEFDEVRLASIRRKIDEAKRMIEEHCPKA